MGGARGFAFNAATLWIPGLILTCAIGGFGPAESLLAYFPAYLLFISLYEIGYLANDTWGTRNDPTPRRRIPGEFGALFVSAFVAIRLGAAAAVAVCEEFLGRQWFWWIIGALVVATVLHNTLGRKELKLMTFFQMSLLRFSTPVVLALGNRSTLLVLLLGALLFVFQRFLTYEDAKGLLSLPEKKEPAFVLSIHLCCLPAIALLYGLSGEPGVLWLWGYFLALGLSIVVAARLPFVSRRVFVKTKPGRAGNPG
jgi:hypothetical protein